MEDNKEKVDEMALALLYLTSHEDYGAMRAWKGMDWDVLDRLFLKGYIGNPKTKAKSVVFTEEGFNLSEQLFEKHFGIFEDDRSGKE